jgi:hypothetical protein
MNVTTEPTPKSEKMTALEDELQKLINGGIARIESHKITGEHLGPKTNITLATYAALSKSAEAVLTLAKELNPEPAFTVLRSMQEGFINLSYVLQDDGNARVVAMIYGGADSDLDKIGKLDEYLKSHPREEAEQAGLEGARESIAKLEEMREQARKELESLDSPEFKRPHYPSLFERAERYDKANADNGVATHLVLDYRMIYYYLSQYTHLGTTALASYLSETDAEIQINPKNPVHDCEIVLHSAYSMLGDTLMLTLGQIGAATEGVLELMKQTAAKLKPTHGS